MNDDEGCVGFVIAGLTAYGFHQLNWPWALGAVVGIFATSVIVFLDRLIPQRNPGRKATQIESPTRGLEEIESRMDALEEAVRHLQQERPPPV